MIIASCGHQLKEDSWGNAIEYQEYDRIGDLCTIYSTVCDDCLDWYVKEMNAKLILVVKND